MPIPPRLRTLLSRLYTGAGQLLVSDLLGRATAITGSTGQVPTKQADGSIAFADIPSAGGAVPESAYTTDGGVLVATGAGAYSEVIPSPSDTLLVLTRNADNTTSWVAPTGGGGVTDHGALTGLGDDGHTQYHTDGRALIWLGTRSTSDLPEGAGLYYTDARVAASAAVVANTAHRGIVTGNPHSVTAAEVGADPAGTAATAVGDHESALEPHPQYTTTVEAAAAAPVQSVAGRTGVVTLDAADIAETAALKILTAAERDAIVANSAKVSNATHTGAVTGATILSITDRAVTAAKLFALTSARFLGRTTAGSGSVEQLTAAQMRTALAVFSGETHTITRQVAVAPGVALEPTTDVFAPFTGTMTVARYVVEGTTPAAGTGLTTVINATTTTTMVDAQDAIAGIGAAPVLLTSVSTAVAAGDRITTEITYAGTVTPPLNGDGVTQSRIGFVYTFTRSA